MQELFENTVAELKSWGITNGLENPEQLLMMSDEELSGGEDIKSILF